MDPNIKSFVVFLSAGEGMGETLFSDAPVGKDAPGKACTAVDWAKFSGPIKDQPITEKVNISFPPF